MDKIKLSKEEKQFLLALNNSDTKMNFDNLTRAHLFFLEQQGFIELFETEYGKIVHVVLTDFGKSYLLENPELKNPTIFDDKKFWITTSISIVALIVSAFALIISINKN